MSGRESERQSRQRQTPGCQTGAAILDATARAIRSYVTLTSLQATAVALWVTHTHALEAARVTPYLAITSAEKRSGKSQLLEVLELLAARAWKVITPSDAVVFRKIAADMPSLLLDEVDAIFGPKARDNEGLRALLNAGHRRGLQVARCEGPNHTLREFDTFCPKALAGIGDLPDTVADRSIPIRLRRRSREERISRFRYDDVAEALAPLRNELEEWAASHADALVDARPDVPDALNDRAADGWEPLLAIADEAGGEWPGRARLAAVSLSTGEEAEDESTGVLLLESIRQAFADRDRLSSADLLEALNDMDDMPWGEWHGGPLTARGLHKLLRPYRVRSRQVRIGADRAQGFLRDSFEDLWTRYLPRRFERDKGSS